MVTTLPYSTTRPTNRRQISPPAHAARVVIAEQAFAVGGGKSDTGNTTHAPLVSGAVVLARGDTLFETLWLNLTVFSNKDPLPVWRMTPPYGSGHPPSPTSNPAARAATSTT